MLSPVRNGIAVFVVLTVSLTIAGCASTGGLAPHAHALDPAALDAGAALRSANADARWPSTDWWRAYGDPQLNAWIDTALADNPSLAVAQARVRAAQSLAGVAQAALAPQVDGNLSLQRQHWPDNLYYGPGPLADANTYDNTGSLTLSWHPDLWGKDRNGAERALDTAHASAADARAAQLELEANVVRAYVGLSMNYALLDIARTTLAQQQRIVTLATRRLNGGLGTQLEVSEAQTPLPEYERQIDELEENIALARNQLAALAGKGPGAGDALARPTLSLLAPAGLPSTLPADLLGHRPDVVAARWRVAAQARGIDVAHARFYPDIDLLASLGGYAAAGPLFQFLHAANGGWSAGPALSLPIFDGGRLRAQLGAADAGYDAAVAQYNQTVVDALKEVADQIVRIRSLDAQRRDAARSVDAAQRNYALSKASYQRGLSDYLNVLVAQNQLLRAQQGVARIAAARLAAQASLMTALGGGLATPADSPSATQSVPAPAHGPLAALAARLPRTPASGSAVVPAVASAFAPAQEQRQNPRPAPARTQSAPGAATGAPYAQ